MTLKTFLEARRNPLEIQSRGFVKYIRWEFSNVTETSKEGVPSLCMARIVIETQTHLFIRRMRMKAKMTTTRKWTPTNREVQFEKVLLNNGFAILG